MSDQTKRALAKSLNNVLNRKPLDKITISDLTNDCGVNRQTFYYHFHDIYDLIEWIYVTGAYEAIGENKKFNNWQEGMYSMCQLMLKHKDFLLKTYHSRSGGHLAEILLQKSYDLLSGVVNEITEGTKITEENKAFIANFYKYGFTGITLEWIDHGMKESPADLVERVDKIMAGSFPEAVRRFAKYESESYRSRR